jgi:hypothetical protein
MWLPTTTYRHGCDQDQRGNNASVRSHCFTTHPMMGGETVTVPTVPCTVYHRSPSREDKTRPVLRNLGDSALSIRSRPGLDPTSTLGTVQRKGKDGMAWRSGSFRRLVSHDAMVSRDGRPFLGHVATVISTGFDKTSPQDSGVLASSCPIKDRPGPYREGRNNEQNTR